MYRARNTDPVTSFMAADSAEEFAYNHSEQIIAGLKQHGRMGKSAIAEATGLDHSQVARRVKEIEGIGLIQLTGKLVKNRNNRSEQEWEIASTQNE
jgi:predicted transcriptional regulator